MIETLLLYLFAGTALAAAASMIFQRSPMRVALALILCMMSLAAVYALLDVQRRQPAAPARAADAAAIGRLVGGTVDRAQDPALVDVEELAFLPVHLGGHVHAAVEVGDRLAVEARLTDGRLVDEQLFFQCAINNFGS